jgi:tagatose 6-phosphate kinase
MNNEPAVGHQIRVSHPVPPVALFRVVSANPLLDLIYHTESDVLENRVFFETTMLKAGGFGPNTARSLVCLGESVECHIISGGVAGKLIRKDLIDGGIRVVNQRGKPSRIATIWISSPRSRMLVSPSPTCSPRALHRLFNRLQEMRAAQDVILVGGSVPEDAMPTYLKRIRALSLASSLCFCDVRTQRWRDLLSAKPLVLKLPNGETDKLPIKGKIKLLGEAVSEGAGLALCSAGPRLLLARTAKEMYSVEAPAVPVVNPYGAGDCLIAAFAASIARKKTIRRSLQEAVAAAAASVMTPVPGEFEPATAQRLLPRVRMESKPISGR